MAITLEESGLSQEQYETLMYAQEDPAYQVIAHRYDLDFSFVDNELTRSDKSFWDCVAIPELEVVAWMMDSTVKFLNEDGTLSEFPDISLLSVSNVFHSPSMFWDGDNLHIFYGTTTAVSRRTYTLDAGGHTLDSTTAFTLGLGSNETVAHIAAVASDRLHYVIKHSTRRTNQFAVASPSTATKSRIYYQYPIQSFSAVALGDQDIIVVATQTPGSIAIKTVGTEVKKTIEYSGGILAWTYQGGIWSDHYFVDIVDKMNNPNVRKSVRLSIIHDHLALTAYVATGAAPFTMGGYRLYTSKDGVHWTFGRIIPVDTAGLNYGAKMVGLGDSLLLCDYGGVMHSSCTLELGYSPASMQVDITANISKYTLSHDGAASANIVLENEDDEYTDHPILDSDHSIILEHRSGYWVNGEKILVLTAMTEVDSVEFGREEEKKNVSMVARDYLAWMADKYSSENAQYWESQLIGADTFLDSTDTRYGGLRHTAVLAGSWQTNSSILELASKNQQGIAFGTFSTYIWNGSFESKFKLAQTSNKEQAGLMFRAMDKDNGWAAIYDQQNDKIYLYEIRNAVKSQKDVSGTMSWASAAVSNYRWLRVSFYYGLVKVYSSNDGVTWTERIDYIATGQSPAGTTASILLDNGSVGYIGKGYHADTSPSTPSFELPDFESSPPDMNNGTGVIIPVTGDVDAIGDSQTPEEDIGGNSPFGTYDFWSALWVFGADAEIPETEAAKIITGGEAQADWALVSGVFDGDLVLIPPGANAQARVYKLLKTAGFNGVDEPEEVHKVRIGYTTSHTAVATDVLINQALKHRRIGQDIEAIHTFDPPDSGTGMVLMYGIEVGIKGVYNHALASGGIRWIEIFGKGFFRP